MVKIIEIDGNVFRLDNNAGWLLEYQDQFGHDILPDIMPIIGAVFEYFESVAATGVTLKEARDVTKAIGRGANAPGALIELSGFRVTDLINVVWALAKTADPEIDPPRQWVRQFDPFPFDALLPEVFLLVSQGLMTSKNWTRLQNAIDGLRAKSNA